ncbi:MAG: DUF5618 family protein [Bacteroidales bacterium]|nr:DUF5618 family protein [Bacteroidales bacterium]
MECDNTIDEAKRYLDNAKEILRDKAVKQDGYYTDSKYIRMAGNTMWNGCLLILADIFHLKPKKGRRLDINDFKEAVSKRSKKLLNDVVEGYNIMHLYMGYDGTKDVPVVQSGVQKMENIIEWCEQNS